MSKQSKAILETIEHSLLSTALRKTLHLAQRSSQKDIERWCKLELGGYFASNPAMGEDIVVPEYRTVVGQHYDIFGRILMLQSDLEFINETRLRNGVEELEALVNTREMVIIHDSHMCDLIKQHLKVEVYSFRFSSVTLTGVLSAIRIELAEKLEKLNKLHIIKDLQVKGKNEEILELRPNFHGIGINLRALWRRWRGAE